MRFIISIRLNLESEWKIDPLLTFEKRTNR